MTAPDQMILNAQWKNDCQGKKDYDGEILSISTRYYPGANEPGGMLMMERTPQGTEISVIPFGESSSASSSLVIYSGEDGAYLTLAEQEFEGGNFVAVARQVERWAQEQMDKAVMALKVAFDYKEARP